MGPRLCRRDRGVGTYAGQILVFGAEFTKVWTKRRGSGFRVAKAAKPVTAEARRARLGTVPRCSDQLLWRCVGLCLIMPMMTQSKEEESMCCVNHASMR